MKWAEEKRVRFFYSYPCLLLVCLALVVLPALLTYGETPAPLPGNNLSLSNSDEHLKTWETLSANFNTALKMHEMTLNEALLKVQTSENNGRQLNDLLSMSLKQNADLKSFNEQISQRMQERDEDYVALYDTLEKLRYSHFRLIIFVTVLCFMIVGYIAIKVVLFYITKK
jgi:ABC-type multidrug transport system fused ATPase/permease subunit